MGASCTQPVPHFVVPPCGHEGLSFAILNVDEIWNGLLHRPSFRSKAFPSTKSSRRDMVSSLRLTSPLFKRGLPGPGTGAAFPGGCLTASCYRSSLSERQDVRLPGFSFSRTKSGQLAFTSLRSETGGH